MSEQPFAAVQVSEHVYWVGAIDWSLRDFHGYATHRGTSYNAYLVVGDEITLVDTVHRPFLDEMLARIASVVDPIRIDWVISHHAELDHTGALPEVVQRLQPRKVVTSAMGVAALAAHFRLDVPVEGVKDGARLELGGMPFTFYETRMLHWPESMFSYLAGDEVLFSQDAFGMHLASFERFADEVPADVVAYETAKYFANILMPFPNYLEKILARLGDLATGAALIATDHGPIWRRDFETVLDRYRAWTARRAKAKVVVAYDTMWKSTAAMGRAIAEGAAAAGAEVKLHELARSHRSDVATDVLDAAALVVGSPNLNGQLFPTVADLLSYLRGLKPRGLIGAAFGSYGWSPSAGAQVEAGLREVGVEIVRDPLLVKFVPQADDLARCRTFGAELGARVQAMAGTTR